MAVLGRSPLPQKGGSLHRLILDRYQLRRRKIPYANYPLFIVYQYALHCQLAYVVKKPMFK